MPDLVRWNPWNELAGLREDLNRIIGRWGRFPEDGLLAGYGWQPPMDVFQTDDEVVVRAELPGLAEDEIRISAMRNSLTIAGELRREREVKEESYLRRERRMGSFSRTITLPVEVNPEKARAHYRHGLLEIHLPKSEEARPRPIRINLE